MPGDFFRVAAGGIDLFVRLTPRADRDSVEGAEETAEGRVHLKVRVCAAPEKGAANAALEKLIARHLGLRRRDVTVAAGATARVKTLRLECDPDAVAAKLRAIA